MGTKDPPVERHFCPERTNEDYHSQQQSMRQWRHIAWEQKQTGLEIQAVEEGFVEKPIKQSQMLSWSPLSTGSEKRNVSCHNVWEVPEQDWCYHS
jgi:hypothetical protein